MTTLDGGRRQEPGSPTARRTAVAWLVIFVLAAPGGAVRLAAASGPECRASGRLVRIPHLREASGLAASRRTPDVLWTHNDSGEPALIALDREGRVTGRVAVAGAEVEDWEALAAGTCRAGSCLYIGDIGDNDAGRQWVTVYRLPEPDVRGRGTAAAEALSAVYPDGPQDAETLLIAPDGRLFIVTKGATGPVALYAFPRELRSGERMRLERVGRARPGPGRHDAALITDGAVSPDGRWVVLRTTGALIFHEAAAFFAGQWREAGAYDLGSVGEPQGEGVAFDREGVLYLVGEGGGLSRQGTFATIECALP